MKLSKVRFEELFFLVLGVLLFSFTQKLPNWRWMGQKTDPNFSMFDTGLSIFRPWLPVEAFEWNLTGQNYFADNLTYGLLGGWILYLLYVNIDRRILPFIISSIPLVIAIWYTANGGTLYDITGLFSLIFLMVLIRRLNNQIQLWGLIGFGVLLAMLDLSRPFAFNIALLILFYLIYKIKWKAIVPIFVFVLLVAPFHINQLVKFNTFELSTYGGNNLIEALDSNFLAADNCYAYELAKQLDTYEAAECAAINKQKVFAALKNDPGLIFQTLNLKRLEKVMFPNLVWHATGLNPEDPPQRVILVIFKIWLGIVYVLGVMAIFKKNDHRYQAILLAIAFYIISITLVANRLSEVLRVSLPALAVLTLLAQTYFIYKEDKSVIGS